MTQQIIVQQDPCFPQVIIEGVLPIGTIIPFTFTATFQGQTIFGPLPSIPTAMICLAITGTMQNQAGGDYSISGLNIVLTSGVNIGDTVYGAYEL